MDQCRRISIFSEYQLSSVCDDGTICHWIGHSGGGEAPWLNQSPGVSKMRGMQIGEWVPPPRGSPKFRERCLPCPGAEACTNTPLKSGLQASQPPHRVLSLDDV
jgi:hypothetical protein